ncbi:MAG: hypothetical protein QNJ89_15225 [Acidimicrobiia bacterium]|nr:hypothetical protein [Acidimicrobiia bacterium]
MPSERRYVRAVYWLRPPPYLRWLVAALLIVLGFGIEARGGNTESYPFAANTITAGTEISTFVEWRTVPAGLLPKWEEPLTGAAGHDVPAGHPLLPGLSTELAIPSGWWSIPVPVPVSAAPGTRLRLLNSITGELVDGILTVGGTDDGFETVAMVAFSPGDALRAAQTVTSDAFVVMIGQGDAADRANG